jgi:putative long chain acyl-CoA synthase
MGPVTRLGAAAQNVLEVARFGGLATDGQPSPFDVVSEQRVYRLHYYYAQTAPSGPPVVLVPPLMLAAEAYDNAPSTSAAILREHGTDPWVVDFDA